MDAFAVDFDVIAVGEVDEDVVVVQGISHLQGFYCHWFVVGSLLEGQSVAESDECVDFEFGFALGPGGDGEEGADEVSVDGEELETSVGPFDCAEVEEAGLGEIVPIFFLEGVINKFVDVVVVPLALDGQDSHLALGFLGLEHSSGDYNAAGEEEGQEEE